MSRATVKELHELHGILAKEFRKRIQDGTATAADLAQARQFLKDNNVETLATPDNPLGQLGAALTDGLPFAGSDGPSH
jgi:hypothetical protein